MAGLRGNRTWTFMVYLNEELEGGATRFTKIDYAIKPKTGMAVLWNNLHVDGSINPFTMHCGEPVISGHKLIITKWFRVHGDGPLFPQLVVAKRRDRRQAHIIHGQSRLVVCALCSERQGFEVTTGAASIRPESWWPRVSVFSPGSAPPPAFGTAERNEQRIGRPAPA
jgi:hypothetical protein